MKKSYKLNVDCWFYDTVRVGFAFIFQVSTPPATKPREICTKCFEVLVSNNLQGDKMQPLAYFICIFI